MDLWAGKTYKHIIEEYVYSFLRSTLIYGRGVMCQALI